MHYHESHINRVALSQELIALHQEYKALIKRKFSCPEWVESEDAKEHNKLNLESRVPFMHERVAAYSKIPDRLSIRIKNIFRKKK